MTTTVTEPLVYSDESRHSFFRDVILAQIQRDPDASERLARHQKQMVVERAERAKRDAALFGSVVNDLEARANPSSGLGAGGEFDVPLTMLDKFASAGRAGRTLADLVGSTPLPPGISSIHIPRMTTGSQATVNIDGEAVAQNDIVSTDVVAPVVTIAGQLDVSQQIFDQAPLGFDTYAYADLNRAYNRVLDVQMVSGTGQSGQLLGVLNVPGISTVNGAATTNFSALWPQIGQSAAAVGNGRFLPPEVFLMAPRRWFWIASSLDASNRPISSPGNGAPQPTKLAIAGNAAPIGPLLGIPGYLDGAIPAGPSPDSILALRVSDMFLFEGPPRLITAPNPLAGTLQIRMSLHRYVAWVPHRYPASIAAVINLPQPAGF